jgi:hypothetical protein
MSDDLTTEEYYAEEQQAQEEAYYFHTIKEFEALVKAFGAEHIIDDLSKEVVDEIRSELYK